MFIFPLSSSTSVPSIAPSPSSPLSFSTTSPHSTNLLTHKDSSSSEVSLNYSTIPTQSLSFSPLYPSHLLSLHHTTLPRSFPFPPPINSSSLQSNSLNSGQSNTTTNNLKEIPKDSSPSILLWPTRFFSRNSTQGSLGGIGQIPGPIPVSIPSNINFISLPLVPPLPVLSEQYLLPELSPYSWREGGKSKSTNVIGLLLHNGKVASSLNLNSIAQTWSMLAVLIDSVHFNSSSPSSVPTSYPATDSNENEEQSEEESGEEESDNKMIKDTILETMEYYSRKGDVQMVVTIGLILNWGKSIPYHHKPLSQNLTPSTTTPHPTTTTATTTTPHPTSTTTTTTTTEEDKKIRRWVEGYLEVLERWELWSKASEVRKLCGVEGVKERSKINTGYGRVSCGTCEKSDKIGEKGWWCKRCAKGMAVCAVCHQVVRGIWAWCQVCGHGGDMKCMKDWFETRGEKECPFACNHCCTFVF